MAKVAFDVRLIGDKALIKKFRRLETVEAKKVLRKALRNAARPIFNETKRRAPIATGKLKSSIKLRALPRSRVRIGVQIVAGEGLDYASFVELGTHGNPGKAFMRGAADEYRAKFPDEVGRLAGPEIERAAKRA